jgi:hypothetical protein
LKKRLYPAVLERGPRGALGAWFPDFPITRIDKRATELGMSRSSFFGFAATIALDWSPHFPRAGLADPRSKVHKTGAVRAGSKPGKKRT